MNIGGDKNVEILDHQNFRCFCANYGGRAKDHFTGVKSSQKVGALRLRFKEAY